MLCIILIILFANIYFTDCYYVLTTEELGNESLNQSFDEGMKHIKENRSEDSNQDKKHQENEHESMATAESENYVYRPLIRKIFGLIILIISPIKSGISPVHDFKNLMNKKLAPEKNTFSSPYKVLQHLDNSILKATSNVTQSPAMEENLYQLSKDLVSAILTKLEIQDKITRITREALDAPGKVKGMTAIETRRILDYISKTLSGHILSLTRASTEPELHRLVYGLAQIAAEVSIVSALKDITYAIALSKKQSSDLSLRKKRDTSLLLEKLTTSIIGVTPANVDKNIAQNPVIELSKNINSTTSFDSMPDSLSPYSVIPRGNKKTVHVISSKSVMSAVYPKQFLNKTALDIENQDRMNMSDAVLLDNKINTTEYVTVRPQLDAEEANHSDLIDDSEYTINPDVAAEIEIEQPEVEEEIQNEKKAKQKLEKLELKAKKAILHAGDVAFLTAASVVAMRRALTASIEVQMSVKYAKNGMSNHQDLMMNLAKTAAQQAGKEAKSATSKSLACERVIKLALKYTAQSKGAKLNHVATRITMETLSLATLAKSMAFVSSDIAINSLYSATDVKPPS